MALELDREVAGVGLGHRGQAQLQAGAARSVFDLGNGVQDAVDVLQHAIGLGQRAARGHDVVENEAALIHLRQQIGAKRLVAGPGADYQQQADGAGPQRLGQNPVENALMHAQRALHQTRRRCGRARPHRPRVSLATARSSGPASR